MKVSERILSKNPTPKGVESPDAFSASNPLTGDVGILCVMQFRFEPDFRKSEGIKEWQVDNEFLTDTEIEEFNKK